MSYEELKNLINSTVWTIDRDENGEPWDITGRVLVGLGSHYVITTSNPTWWDGHIGDYIIEETQNDSHVGMYAYPFEDVYPTLETARETCPNIEGGD